MTDQRRHGSHPQHPNPSAASGSALAPLPPGDAVNRLWKRGNDPFGNQRIPLMSSYPDRQDDRPSTGNNSRNPAGTAVDDRDHLNCPHLPAACPAPDGEGIVADPSRVQAVGIDDEGSLRKEVDQ